MQSCSILYSQGVAILLSRVLRAMLLLRVGFVELFLTSDDYFAASEGSLGYRNCPEPLERSLHALSEGGLCIVGLRVPLSASTDSCSSIRLLMAFLAASEEACTINAHLSHPEDLGRIRKHPVNRHMVSTCVGDGKSPDTERQQQQLTCSTAMRRV